MTSTITYIVKPVLVPDRSIQTRSQADRSHNSLAHALSACIIIYQHTKLRPVTKSWYHITSQLRIWRHTTQTSQKTLLIFQLQGIFGRSNQAPEKAPYGALHAR